MQRTVMYISGSMVFFVMSWEWILLIGSFKFQLGIDSLCTRRKVYKKDFILHELMFPSETRSHWCNSRTCGVVGSLQEKQVQN